MSWIDVTSPIRNVNCLLNNRCKLFAWGRWLRGFCPLPLYVGEMWKLLVCSKFKSWLYKWRLYFRFDQEAACQKALIAFFFFLLCTGKGIWFDSFLKGVCFVCGYFCVQGVCVCVWDLFASLPSPLALRIEATPASLPLFFSPSSILLSVMNVGSGKSALVCWKCFWMVWIWIFFSFFSPLWQKRRDG